MRILVAQNGDLLSLLDDGPLRREELEVRSIADPGEVVRATRDWSADLCLLSCRTDSRTLDRIRRAGVSATTVSDSEQAAAVLLRAGIPPRASERVPLHVEARLRAQGLELRGSTKDLSLTGAFVRCEPFLEAGAEVELQLEGEGGPLRLPARVVRAVPEASEHLTGLGLVFGELTGAQRAGLEHLLSRPARAPRIPGLRYGR